MVVARNAASSVAIKAGMTIGTLGLSALLSRHVGVQGFGLYAYALSIANLLGIVVLFGLDQIAIRELSQSRIEPSEMLGQALAIQFGFAAASLGCVILVTALIGVPTQTTLVVMICAVQVFLEGMSITLISLFRARQRMEYEAAIAWLWCLLLVGLTALSLYLGLSLPRLLALITLSYVVRLATIGYLLRAHFDVTGLRKAFRPRRHLIIAALPFAGMTGLQMLYNTYPRLIVGNILGLHDVGLYAAAERVMQMLLGLFIIADMVVFPIFAKDIHISRERFAATYRLAADAFMAVGLLVGLAFAAFAKEIIALLYGPQFAESAKVLALLIPAVSMGIPGFVNARAMIVMHRERFLLLWTAGMVCLGVVGTLLAVPRWGLTGMVWAWSFPIALGFAFFFCFIRRELELPWVAWRYGVYFATFVSAFAVSYMVRNDALWIRLTVHASLILALMGWYLISGFLSLRKLSDLAQMVRRNRSVRIA
jgi:O-antigen/teichoic acid export membrane protein